MMTKTEYIKEITKLMNESDDDVLLDFILKMLKRASLHKTA